MNVLRIQGLAFSVLATLLAAIAMVMRPFSQKTELCIMAGLIVIFGVPHGALDTVFARRIYNLRTTTGWFVFVLAYLSLVLLVVVLWQAAPALFLAGFLLISGAHFSGDPAEGTPPAVRFLYGGAMIVLPLLRHAREVGALFSVLAGATASAQVLAFLEPLALPWLIALTCATVYSLTTNRFTTAELAAVALLGIFTEPLLAFTVFFCGMHSARHILRTLEYAGSRRARQLLATALAPMLAVVAAATCVFFWLPNLPVETRIVQLLFVGLASLTVPHMLLVERVRSAGWADKGLRVARQLP